MCVIYISDSQLRGHNLINGMKRKTKRVCSTQLLESLLAMYVPGNHGYVETLFFFILQFPVSLGSVCISSHGSAVLMHCLSLGTKASVG